MPQLVVEFTQEQYNRFKAGLQVLHDMDAPPEDDQLILQMKREASSIVYAAEIGTKDGTGWTF